MTFAVHFPNERTSLALKFVSLFWFQECIVTSDFSSNANSHDAMEYKSNLSCKKSFQPQNYRSLMS